MEQVETSKTDNSSNIVNRKRGVENLASFVTANKKALLSKDDNARQLEKIIPNLNRVEHQSIMSSSTTKDIYKIKNTAEYESRFNINCAQRFTGEGSLVEIGVRLEDDTGTLLTQKSRNELCPVKFFFEYLIKKIEVRYLGEINMINHSPLTRARVIEQHMKMFSLTDNQMKIQGDIFNYNPAYVGDGVTVVAETKLEAATNLTSAQKYFYELAKKFHSNVESDGYVYYWLPLSMLCDLFNGNYPLNTNGVPLEIKILENSDLTTKNLFVKYQKNDSTHFSDGSAVGASDKINLDNIVTKIKLDRIRLELIEYSDVFNTIFKNYNTGHMNEGVTLYEGQFLGHKEVTINTDSDETNTINIPIANYEASNMLILNLFNMNFPYKSTINAEAYRTSILQMVKTIELSYYDVNSSTNRKINYDLDKRDDRLELFNNFKACLIGNNSATSSPMIAFNNKNTLLPKLNNFSYNTYWKKSGTNYVNNELPIVLNLDLSKRTITNALPPVKIQSVYELKLKFRSTPTSQLNLVISRDYIGGYKLIRKSIKDDEEIVFYPSAMKGV